MESHDTKERPKGKVCFIYRQRRQMANRKGDTSIRKLSHGANNYQDKEQVEIPKAQDSHEPCRGKIPKEWFATDRMEWEFTE